MVKIYFCIAFTVCQSIQNKKQVVQEFLAASDVVITDYSSRMRNCSLQRKPVFLYQSGEKEYESNGGFYVSVSEWLYLQTHTQLGIAGSY
ncbi:CDP-glycerol glycerophosphotransferase family protein [Enterocloster sp. 210928-DFI.2.20]|uniref:CDP-glycerol glycerophosphotransferase family protein n=1 Tax=Enterocloster TaxID=2719313 RepID=UPI001D0859F2|nr:CDP-glycerol glycerophosphotransferase family protein [Enterocloster sp. 210928-DFI.2.20]MCB7353430.1 CDP-glycerol glycerophosphotransferase family protein [Enterocloster bolteae]